MRMHICSQEHVIALAASTIPENLLMSFVLQVEVSMIAPSRVRAVAAEIDTLGAGEVRLSSWSAYSNVTNGATERGAYRGGERGGRGGERGGRGSNARYIRSNRDDRANHSGQG